jgi:hypothetical protein
MASVQVRLGLDCSQEKDFPRSSLRGGNAPQERLSGAPFPRQVVLVGSAKK